MITKNANIIPITFVAGSGGRFISYLINSAKAVNPKKIEFSKYGNAHALWDLNIELVSTPFNNFVPAGEHAKIFFKAYANVRQILKYKLNNPLPYYGSCHTDDIDGLLFYFNKVINITYEDEDIHNIALVFVGKSLVDDAKINDENNLKQLYFDNITRLTNTIRKPNLKPEVLNISWKDVYQNDPNSLIRKLSDFSNIPFEKFNMDALLEWRHRTMNCINEMGTLLDSNPIKSTKIIPITFMGGTGGNFLSHLLTTAKINNRIKLKLSKYGNAHTQFKEINIPAYSIDIDSFMQVNHLYQMLPKKAESNPPFFVSCHIRDHLIVADRFEKSIRITYEKDDIDMLSKVMLGKYALESLDISTDDTATLQNLLRQYVGKYTRFLSYFQNQSTDNILCVRWKDLIQNDPDDLILKLSNFTGINKERFDITHIVAWRDATLKGVEEIQALVNVAK